MTVLSVNAPRKTTGGEIHPAYLAASANPYQGSLLSINSAGYINELVAGERFAGISMQQVETADVPTAAATYAVSMLSGHFLFEMALSGIAVTDVGRRVYASDDNTLTFTEASNTFVGYVDGYVSSGIARVRAFTPDLNGRRHVSVNVAASAAVSAATATAFSRSYSVPANTLVAGSRIKIRAQGIATETATAETLTVKLLFGTTELCTTGAVNSTNDDIFYFDGLIVVRTAGASGTLVACGTQANGVMGTVTAKPWLLGSTAVDTTAAIAITVTAAWNAATAGVTCRLDILSVEVLA